MESERIIFKRKIYDKMLEWKESKKGSTALLIKGARRVGKSTIAEQFARNEYDSYIVVDFADAPAALWEAVNNISDRNNFFMQLQFIYGVNLYERRSVIIFDEIQLCPQARQAIKYLVKDHRYDFIETVGDTATIPLLQTAFNSKTSLGEAVTRKLLRDMRLYMLVGGMPQAVETYIRTNNLTEVDIKKREIIELYFDDFLKIDSSGKITQLFSEIPAQLSKNASRYQATSVLGRSENKETLAELLRNLEDSLTVNFAHHANDPNIGLPMHADYSQYKMFLADTGLFITLAFWDKNATENIIYQKLLSDKLSADIGYVYENLVAQILTVGGNKLFYHTWPTKDGKHNYEIETRYAPLRLSRRVTRLMLRLMLLRQNSQIAFFRVT